LSRFGEFGEFKSEVKIILQSQVAECGLGCIAMVASVHGQIFSLANLRQRFPQSLKGANLKQVLAARQKVKVL
jgi:ATP-binding cassette subfamily B protein RaxB